MFFQYSILHVTPLCTLKHFIPLHIKSQSEMRFLIKRVHTSLDKHLQEPPVIQNVLFKYDTMPLSDNRGTSSHTLSHQSLSDSSSERLPTNILAAHNLPQTTEKYLANNLNFCKLLLLLLQRSEVFRKI